MNGENERKFYAFVDVDFKLIYNKVGGAGAPEDAKKVYLGSVNSNGFKELRCNRAILHWDNNKKNSDKSDGAVEH